MKAIIATLLTVVIISCSEEEALVNKPEPLPQSTLQFQLASLTIMEGQKVGECGRIERVVIQASESPGSPTLYYVTMKYKATNLGGGAFSSRFYFEGSHTKFDGTTSHQVVLKNAFDEPGIMTTVIQLEFVKDNLSSFFEVSARNDSQTSAPEVVKLEVSSKNPLTGVCPSHFNAGERNSMNVTIEDFH